MHASPLPSSKKIYQTERIANIHILILISSERAADLVKRLFLGLGFKNLHIAYDAAEAIQFLRDLQLHLIVTDVDLKVREAVQSKGKESSNYAKLQISGIEFVHRLRSANTSPAPFIPVLMLMDYARSNVILKARDVGVNEIVLKPLEAKNFCERIVDLVDKPRLFVTATTYRGPCRRRKPGKPPKNTERRTHEIRLVRCNEFKGMCA